MNTKEKIFFSIEQLMERMEDFEVLNSQDSLGHANMVYRWRYDLGKIEKIVIDEIRRLEALTNASNNTSEKES